ncbi:MAG TPA: HAMP domain-containing sensor histidine kinase [Kofleriaceae bacterium]|jgi:signal transduction histidine kinase
MSSEPSEPRRRRWSSLAVRLNGWYVAAFVASLAALVAFAVPAVRGAMEREDSVVVETRLEQHVAVLTEAGLPAYRTAVEHAARLDDHELPVRVSDAEGRTVFEHGDVGNAWRTAERDAGELRLEVGVSDEPWHALWDRLRFRALLLAIAAVLLALVGGMYFTHRSLRPIRELAATARDVTRSGDLSRRVTERGTGDELDELSASFNRMLERNQRLVRGMRDALDNVAHDLRTPLTRLRGSAEVALRETDPASAREALADCVEETDRALVMLRALMDVSEAETGIMRLDRRAVALDRLAADVVDLYGQVADDAGISLSLAEAPEVVVSVDATRVRQAIANLVDNALKYTARGGKVSIEIARAGEQAIVRVSDTGEGIAPDALPRIWDRLYRGDASRTRPGLGLGLSLVKAIVTAHGGTVAVESTPGIGSIFTIALPIDSTQSANAVSLSTSA